MVGCDIAEGSRMGIYVLHEGWNLLNCVTWRVAMFSMMSRRACTRSLSADMTRYFSTKSRASWDCLSQVGSWRHADTAALMSSLLFGSWKKSVIASMLAICLSLRGTYSQISLESGVDVGVGGRGEALGLRHSARMVATSRMLPIITTGRGRVTTSRMVASSLTRIRFLCRSESVNPM